MSRPFINHSITDDSALGGSLIERSLRFNDNDVSYLSRTPSSASNRKTFTFSAWVKRSNISTGTYPNIFSSNNSSNYSLNGTYIWFYPTDELGFSIDSGTYYIKTNAKFRDTISWYHVLGHIDTTLGTSSDRVKLYVNGERQTDLSYATYPPQNHDTQVNNNVQHTVGARRYYSIDNYFDGYLAEINFIDGYAYDPSYFGYTESQTGIWRPKRYEGTYGTNGFHLEFKDNSSTSALGTDTSGNGNNFSASNLSVAAGKDGDSFIDTPSNNFSTLNPLVKSNYNQSLSDGNLTRSGGAKQTMSTFELLNGKYYFEYKAEDSNQNHSIGVCQIDTDTRDRINTECAHYFGNGEYKIENNNQTSGFASYTTGDIIGVAVDTTLSPPKIWFAKNNTWQGTGNPTTTGYSLTSGKKYAFSTAHGSSSGSSTGTAFFGAHQGGFNYDPPSGFKALSSKNLPPNVPSIIRPQKHIDTLLYTGNGSTTQNITGLQFAPDFVWIKSRSASGTHHQVFDVIRSVGGDKALAPSRTAGEYSFSAFDLLNNGFNAPYSSSAPYSCNTNGVTYVAWCWKAGGTAVTNNDGSITSQVSVNEEAGFSIISYTGNNTNNATVGHGLGKTPALLITKSRDNAIDPAWHTSHVSLPANYDIALDASDAAWNPSSNGWHELTNSSVFTLKKGSSDGNNTNRNGDRYIAYCWAEIPGYSKFGKYTGNGNTNGAFINLGFKPAWILVKRSSASENWALWDNKRDGGFNPNGYLLRPDSTNDEGGNVTGHQIDLLSNGFKLRFTDTKGNGNGSTYIYMAFAEQPGLTPYDTQTNAR